MNSKRALLRAVALTATLFGLLIWIYAIVIQVTHPDWLPEPFSHVGFFPFNVRFDEVGMAAFAVAAVGFLVWQVDVNLDDN
jgi:hypothetical protein